MLEFRIRKKMKYFLRALTSLLAVIGGFSFFVGGRAIHEFAKVDRLLAELIGLAVAFVSLIGIAVAKHIEDDGRYRVERAE